MAKELLFDTALRAIKPGAVDKDGRPLKRVNDGAGLYLLLFVGGASHGWRFDYSYGGKRKTLSCGSYPATSLRDARAKATEARAHLAADRDPSDVRKEVKLAKQVRQADQLREDSGLPPLGSFEAVAREWLECVHRHKVSPGHASRILTRLEQDVFPWIGRLPMSEVNAKALLTVLRRVEERGAIETAHRIKDSCGQVFRYGISLALCDRDWAFDLKDALKPVKTKSMAAITDPKEAGVLLRAIDSYVGFPSTRAALRLAPLVFQRPGNLRALQWAEVNFDTATWTIPAAKMKRSVADKAGGKPHEVPLSRQAISVLRDIQPLTGHYVHAFPGNRGGDRPISDATLNGALQRMGYDTATEMTTHGFRAMARTMLAERLDQPEVVIEAQLAHAVKDQLGTAYNRTTFADQRRTMMQTWADYLDTLRGVEVA